MLSGPYFLLISLQHVNHIFLLLNRLCILTPREGTRLQQTGDENLLSLAQKRKIRVNFHFMLSTDDRQVNIPVIAVFTKFDELVNEQFLKALKARVSLSETEAERNAQNYFNDRVRDFRQRMQVSVVKVSTAEDYAGLSPCPLLRR